MTHSQKTGPLPVKFVATVRGGEYWVVEEENQYAVGFVKSGRVTIDGCERFSDQIDAQVLAIDRAQVLRAVQT